MINKIGILCTYSFPEGMAPTIRILSYGQGLVDNGCKVEVVVFQPKVGDNAYSLSGYVGGVKYAYAHKGTRISPSYINFLLIGPSLS